MNRHISLAWMSVFTSTSTLVCCALPALLVALGAGVVLSSLVSTFPQLIWLSEHKIIVFGVAGGMLVLAGILQYRARTLACPVDVSLAEACAVTRDYSAWIYWISVGIFIIGAFFAFGAPLFY